MSELVLNSKYMTAFSGWLVEFHYSTGLNSEEFAKALGVPCDVLMGWEMETVIPTKTQVGALAEYNDETVAEVFRSEFISCPDDLFVEYKEPDSDALVSDKPWMPDTGVFKKDKAAFDAYLSMKIERERQERERREQEQLEREKKKWRAIFSAVTFPSVNGENGTHYNGQESDIVTGSDGDDGCLSRSETVEKILNLYNSLDSEGQEAVRLAIGERESDYD